ncbi:MAG: DUF4351 domain-containing protein [Acidobacteria bacterium]|nr:DUF4351 domain-containing protein [Acidobacteriota bacterium]
MLYDATLKGLFQALPEQLLALLVRSRIQELLQVEYPWVRMRRPDLVGRLETGRIYHLELQGENADMRWRMLEYYFLLRIAYGEPPLQQVLYVGNAPLSIEPRIEEACLSFRYEVIDIRQFSAEALLNSHSIADNLLAILCRTSDARATVRGILERVAAQPEVVRRDWLANLLVLSKLRRLQELVSEESRSMPVTIDLSDIREFREAFAKVQTQGWEKGKAQGLVEGKLEGKLEGEVALLRRLLERRFGSLPGWVIERLQSASTDTLEEWGVRVLNAQTLEEVLS